MISTTAVYTATVEDILGDRKHGCTITIEIAPSKNTKFKTVCDIFARFYVEKTSSLLWVH